MQKFTGRLTVWRKWILRGGSPFILLLLVIELLDELHYGLLGAALPALRVDLNLSYDQIGVLLGLPVVLSAFTEPVLMLLGDTRLRKRLIIGGGLAVAAAALITARSESFAPTLVAFILTYPAGGAFVTLSQATLIDLSPGREPHMMARWTVFGALGNLLGPLALAGLYAAGQNWRSGFLLIAALAIGATLLLLPHRFTAAARSGSADAHPTLPELLRSLPEAIRTPGLLRWFVLLNLADLLMDVFLGYSALYFADHVGMTPAQVGVIMSVLMAAGLAGNLALLPLLERVHGRTLVRYSAVISGLSYSAWLLAPWLWAKIILAVVVELSTLGWYEVLQGEAYASFPGRSGTVMAINSVMGLLGGVLVWLVGRTAQEAGLQAAMWLLLAGPIALALFTPKAAPAKADATNARHGSKMG